MPVIMNGGAQKVLLATCRFQALYTPGTHMQNAGTQKVCGGETRAVSMAVWYNDHRVVIIQDLNSYRPAPASRNRRTWYNDRKAVLIRRSARPPPRCAGTGGDANIPLLALWYNDRNI